MKRNILFLVHVEEMFRQYFPDPLYTSRLVKACTCQKYDQVFHMTSCVEDDHPIEELVQCVRMPQLIDWGWGYEPDSFNKEEQEWVIESHGSFGHQWTWIPPELRSMNFSNCNVFIGGGAEKECLADFELVLDNLKVAYTKIKGYVFGA